jgi:D-lyxose ketol-isomerase
MNRREWLTVAGAGLAAASAASLGSGCAASFAHTSPLYAADGFYGAGGSLDQAAAKKAYFDFMAAKGYPVTKTVRDHFWATDFGLGKFTEIGMGIQFWVNDKDQGYSAMDVFLLPNQATPEHQAVKTGDAKAKIATWHVRYGWLYSFTEGDTTPGAEALIPPSQKGFVTALSERILKQGDVAVLARPEEWQWKLAGPDGAIFSEYGTYHDAKASRFTNARVRF